MILLTVGTHSFDSLVEAVDLAVADGRLPGPATLQIGIGKYLPRHCPYFRIDRHLERHYDRARVVITHGGVGSVLGALKRGLPCVAVANPDMKDHHQHDLLGALAGTGTVRWCQDLAELPAEVGKALAEPYTAPQISEWFRFISAAIDAWDVKPKNRRPGKEWRS